jgi:NACHT domain
MVDLFESVIKTYTAVIIAEYFRRNEFSDAVKGLLANGLRTPSLGTWQFFSRELFREMKDAAHVIPLRGFEESFNGLDKALNRQESNVISFRNGYAHGATPTDAQCMDDLSHFEPLLNRMLSESWIAGSEMLIEEDKVHIQYDGYKLCLHPILVERKEPDGPSLAFFNDSKDDKIGLLNYPLSKHYREKLFYPEFQRYFPVQAWRKLVTPDFLHRMEALTDTFKGRISERAAMLDFVRKSSKGFLSVQGNPGIGKSALIAQFFKDLAKEGVTGLQTVAYFINRGTAQARAEQMLTYLLKKTDELFKEGRGILAEGNTLWDMQTQLEAKWRLWGELVVDKRILFLIDGLDEGVEGDILRHLPKVNFEGILFIYGSRPDGHPDLGKFWTELPVTDHRRLLLHGLGKEDIRALIYEVADKYAIGRESDWIDRLAERSEGNPLYLKLLCNAIENGSIAPNDMQALPKEINSYYEAILSRYAADREDGAALLNGLYVFAAAKDPIAFSQLGDINRLDGATLHRISSTLREVLVENPLTIEVLDYRLFHESLREYLTKNKSREVEEAVERIIDYCADWRQLEGSWDQRYALQHMAGHLSDSRKSERVEQLFVLLRDKSYAETQKKVLRSFDASNVLYRKALIKASEQKRTDDMLEAALSLVDLRYEEANEAPKIVEMVANGEIEIALQRIQTFGGNDEDGVRRKFILYMLCLMEMTLLESRDKPFALDTIRRLLQHLDENISTDDKILKWNGFFPSYIMFLMASRLVELGLDYRRMYKDYIWEMEWIPEKGPYSDIELDILLESADQKCPYWSKCEVLSMISTAMSDQGKIVESENTINKAIETARKIDDQWRREQTLHRISIELVKQGNLSKGLLVAHEIRNELERNKAFHEISVELSEKGKLSEEHELAKLISDIGIQSDYITISAELAKKGMLEDALEKARKIREEWDKPRAIGKISTALAKSGDKNESEKVMSEAIETSFRIIDQDNKNSALEGISYELMIQGKASEAIDIALKISEESDKCRAIAILSTELAKQQNISDSGKAMFKLLETSSGTGGKNDINIIIHHICSDFAKNGMISKALETTKFINNVYYKSKTMCSLSTEMSKLGKTKEADELMVESVETARGIGGKLYKLRAFRDILNELRNQDKTDECVKIINESLEIALGIFDQVEQAGPLHWISSELSKLGKIKEAIKIARGISYELGKCRALVSISTQLSIKGKIVEAENIISEAVQTARRITNECERSEALSVLACEMTNHEKNSESNDLIHEALNTAYMINDEYYKGFALWEAIKILLKQEKWVEAVHTASSIKYEYFANLSLRRIAFEFAKKENYKNAEEIALEIKSGPDRHKCWSGIGRNSMEFKGAVESVSLWRNFSSDEAIRFYKRGWTESLKPINANKFQLQLTLPDLVSDAFSIEILLQSYALNCIFFEQKDEQKINRLNKTLNLQWAIDIATKFTKGERKDRSSSNLEEWIDKILDEDDQEQVRLWARQVAKGKLSELTFKDNLVKIMGPQ